MVVEKCDECKKQINWEKHDFIFVERHQGYFGNKHFCSLGCLTIYFDKHFDYRDKSGKIKVK